LLVYKQKQVAEVQTWQQSSPSHGGDTNSTVILTQDFMLARQVLSHSTSPKNLGFVSSPGDSEALPMIRVLKE
jgi:hypothetical protein